MSQHFASLAQGNIVLCFDKTWSLAYRSPQVTNKHFKPHLSKPTKKKRSSNNRKGQTKYVTRTIETVTNWNRRNNGASFPQSWTKAEITYRVTYQSDFWRAQESSQAPSKCQLLTSLSTFPPAELGISVTENSENLKKKAIASHTNNNSNSKRGSPRQT